MRLDVKFLYLKPEIWVNIWGKLYQMQLLWFTKTQQLKHEYLKKFEWCLCYWHMHSRLINQSKLFNNWWWSECFVCMRPWIQNPAYTKEINEYIYKLIFICRNLSGCFNELLDKNIKIVFQKFPLQFNTKIIPNVSGFLRKWNIVWIQDSSMEAGR